MEKEKPKENNNKEEDNENKPLIPLIQNEPCLMKKGDYSVHVNNINLTHF